MLKNYSAKRKRTIIETTTFSIGVDDWVTPELALQYAKEKATLDPKIVWTIEDDSFQGDISYFDLTEEKPEDEKQ